MILTVTANPALDVIYALSDNLSAGELNRAASTSVHAGGKGINVTRAIAAAGGESLACAMLGGGMGEFFSSMLREEGIPVLKTSVSSETRVNICAVSLDGEATEINSKGGPVTMAELSSFFEICTAKASSGDVVILAGSLPPCADGDGSASYTKWISVLREKGCTVIFDGSGETLRLAVNSETPPHMIKPNLDELCELLREDFPVIPEFLHDDEETLFKTAEIASEKIARRGISVLCTLGSVGSVFTSAKDPAAHTRCESVPVSRVVNIKGAGDTFLGTFAYHCFIRNEAIKTSMAYAAKASSDHVGGTK